MLTCRLSPLHKCRISNVVCIKERTICMEVYIDIDSLSMKTFHPETSAMCYNGFTPQLLATKKTLNFDRKIHWTNVTVISLDAVFGDTKIYMTKFYRLSDQTKIKLNLLPFFCWTFDIFTKHLGFMLLRRKIQSLKHLKHFMVNW